ncbi:MAG: ISNCY family transposase [Elusimicrobiota bacterium]|jgi:hypothetical protein
MDDTERINLSMREIDRLRVIRDFLDGRVPQQQAAEQLKLGARQVRRLCRRVKAQGARGIRHGLRGRPGNHQLASGLLERALKLVAAHYHDFGPSFANEKLLERHGLHLSTPTLRKGMVAEGLWRPKRHKPFHRAWRPRRACVGELTQVDGSDHDWFEGRGPRCALITFVDDATSGVLLGRFAKAEDTLTLMRLAKEYFRRYGRPQAFYVDKDSIYKVNRQADLDEQLRDEQPMTQFTRAMDELGIGVICAHSPQAKGRVERGFKTHQHRLVRELRLAGVSSMEEGNRFLDQDYLGGHNVRFAVEAANATDAHRKLLAAHRLDQILSLRSERTMNNDYTLRYVNKFFQVLEHQPVRIRPGDRVQVEVRLDGTTHLRFKDAYLNFKPIEKRPYQPYLQARPSRAKQREHPEAKGVGSTPAKDHPWRRFYLPGSNRGQHPVMRGDAI